MPLASQSGLSQWAGCPTGSIVPVPEDWDDCWAGSNLVRTIQAGFGAVVGLCLRRGFGVKQGWFKAHLCSCQLCNLGQVVLPSDPQFSIFKMGIMSPSP